MRHKCLEPDVLTLEIGGTVKLQIDLLLGEHIVELADVIGKLHQFTGIIGPGRYGIHR